MFRKVARRPFIKTGTYLKYGLVVTEYEKYCCPRCGEALNAGPQYQPKYCSDCGQRVTFKGIEWKADRKVGYELIDKRGDEYASI